MNTQAQVHRLQAGQAISLPLPRRGAGPVVLAQGELLVQEPARWLGGTVVVPAPVRLVAPAVLPEAPSASVTAVRESTVVVPRPAPLLPRISLSAVAAWVRRLDLIPPSRRSA